MIHFAIGLTIGLIIMAPVIALALAAGRLTKTIGSETPSVPVRLPQVGLKLVHTRA
ncbi:hypothetical protein GCM10011415_22470 [Salipiger pallidus]|uniref:Uncharacterized protein n=1 Tax=Salipiger pallidus TaxID=1775170 RepID=A0A8J2ZJZ6_9RHOB|nr:hypothetical protein [Salipiger pallidus]GGG73649.1 hypothetical protein GCM10011415_22470 [Salipiger pallidus]